ncbi:hypothetical protein [Sphingomonas alpina]|uniref:Uncharacterized protein n=1 Tax=Sphingomonas alpina TaxID=653931 RepID=A0A7H0LF53_9SPHN|nr:hypothetical protein [Sphingomonas alpina]QNQ08306.1 hypothetical protein H3Z74_16310 [Sphingomonas alpina]
MADPDHILFVVLWEIAMTIKTRLILTSLAGCATLGFTSTAIAQDAQSTPPAPAATPTPATTPAADPVASTAQTPAPTAEAAQPAPAPTSTETAEPKPADKPQK